MRYKERKGQRKKYWNLVSMLDNFVTDKVWSISTRTGQVGSWPYQQILDYTGNVARDKHSIFLASL
jgi:hypothetical protein